MASTVAENWEYVDARDKLENIELSPINTNFLMSLLDETQLLDDCDDERLANLIRSLEAELDSGIGHYAFDDAVWGNNLMDCQSSNDGSNDQDWSMVLLDDLDLRWTDMEIMPSSPNDGLYTDYHGQGMCGVADFGEFGGKKNYYSHLCYETPLEGQDYSSFLYKTNVNVIE
ncbi:hypothetical protein BUALT_Bualt03G0173400 [Buddleja alternifolia]|uniref:Uncharacterized protein n=1 Tax=Buddleja alternifolia TaxID=168488 RepID=A0AAV6Y336_9LAMI|nr:hypothetical protein BUALT_Bualt03G0173400 [Buddleja alternifolia]